MNQTLIFWPMIAHVVLVYGLYFLISARRKAAIEAGHAERAQFRENLEEPEESLLVRNSMTNQFELPVLFYAVCISLFVTGGVTFITYLLAWVFAVTRLFHAWIHIKTNRIRHRRPMFIVGFFALGLMWIAFAVQLIIG